MKVYRGVRHSPADWYTDTSQFMCSNWTRRNLLVGLNVMSKASASTYTTGMSWIRLASTIPTQY
jgi:hypothetical protein